MMQNQIITLGWIITAMFALLIIIAIFDVYQISEVRNQYNDLSANCPCWNNTRVLNNPSMDYCAYFNVCNNTVNGPFNEFEICRGLKNAGSTAILPTTTN